MNKTMTSMRLTPDAKRLLEKLAAHLGLSQASVLEMAIRAFAKQQEVNNVE